MVTLWSAVKLANGFYLYSDDRETALVDHGTLVSLIRQTLTRKGTTHDTDPDSGLGDDTLG